MREDRRLSQRALAPLLHVSHATISKWETGNAPIDADLLPRIAETLGRHPCDFFEDEQPAVQPGADRMAADFTQRTQALGLSDRELALLTGFIRFMNRDTED